MALLGRSSPLHARSAQPSTSASPIATKDHVYLHNEAGVMYVIKPGAKLDIVSKNSVGDRGDELFRAAAAPIDGQVFMRSTSALYCIGK